MSTPILLRLEVDSAPAEETIALLERAPDRIRHVVAESLADLLHDGIEVRLAEGFPTSTADGRYVCRYTLSLPWLHEWLSAACAGDVDG